MVDAASVPEIAGMLPIHVVDEPSPQPSPSSMNKRVDSDLCEVEFDRARLRIRGQVCPTTLRLLIQELSQ
jgi:transposase